MSETTAETKDVTSREPPELRKNEPERSLLPPVDIFEDADGITLIADIPGVNKERLNLKVEKDSLTVEGEAKIDLPEGLEALHADVRATRYRRSFTLSSELESDAIEASLKDGLLRIRIPKRAEVKPRRIEVRTE